MVEVFVMLSSLVGTCRLSSNTDQWQVYRTAYSSCAARLLAHSQLMEVSTLCSIHVRISALGQMACSGMAVGPCSWA